MSFGVGVGDLLAILNLANQIRQRFVDAPTSLDGLKRQSTGLSNVLRDIEDALPARELSETQEVRLAECISSAYAVLKDVEKFLKKYQEVGEPLTKVPEVGKALTDLPEVGKPLANLSDHGRSGISFRTRRVWKQLTVSQSDMGDLVSRISACIAQIKVFNAEFIDRTTLSIKEGVDRINLRIDRQDRIQTHQKLLQCAGQDAEHNMSSRHDDLLHLFQIGTGKWFLESEKFNTWIQSSGGTLWAPGIPGAGKTMMSCAVIERLRNQKTKHLQKPLLMFYYFEYNRDKELRLKALLFSLLAQIFTQRDAPNEAINISAEYGNQFEEKYLRATVLNCCKEADGAFLVLDALDECPTENSLRKDVIDLLMQLREAGISIFITSRFEADVMKRFGNEPTIEVRAESEDVQTFLEGQSDNLPLDIGKDKKLKKLKKMLFKAIDERIDGMFLLARLHLDSVADVTNVDAFKKKVKSLPSATAGLDKAYEQAVERIESQSQSFKDLAFRTISFLTCVRRVISPMELQHALVVCESPKFKRSCMIQVEIIVSVCAGLVIVDKETKTIRFAHHTTQEFFERKKSALIPNGQQNVALAALRSLMCGNEEPDTDDESDDGYTDSDEVESEEDTENEEEGGAFDVGEKEEDFEADLVTRSSANSSCIFSGYANNYWADHVEGIEDADIIKLTLELLKQPQLVQTSCLALQKACRDSLGVLDGLPKGFTYAVAPMASVMDDVPEEFDLFFPGDDKRNEDPIGTHIAGWGLALYFGLTNVFRELVNQGFDLSRRDSLGRTPLFWAVRWNNLELVKYFLTNEQVTTDVLDKTEGSPIYEAAHFGRTEILKLLLEHAEAHGVLKKPENLPQPVFAAVSRGHAETLAVLLSYPCFDAEMLDSKGYTPLARAASKRDIESMKVILNRPDVTGFKEIDKVWPALFFAFQTVDEEFIELMQKQDGFDINFQDLDGYTALHVAVQEHMPKMLKRLLEYENIKLNLENEIGFVPLSWAAKQGTLDTLLPLLERPGIEVNIGNEWGYTPFMLSVYYRRDKVVERFLELKDLDVNAQTRWGQTAMHIAALTPGAFGVVEQIVDMLIRDRRADLHALDHHLRTALHAAASKGRIGVVKQLLDQEGMNVNAKDKDGNSPFSLAVATGHYELVVHLLESSNPDVNFQSPDGRNVLFIRASNEEPFDMDVTAREQTKFFWPYNYEDSDMTRPQDVVSLLAPKLGGGLSSKDKNGQTLLHFYAEHGNSGMLRIVHSSGQFDVNQKDNSLSTPLFLAVKGDLEENVEALLSMKNMDVNVSGPENKSPLLLAFEQKSMKIARLLLEHPSIDLTSYDSTEIHTIINTCSMENDVATMKSVLSVLSKTDELQNIYQTLVDLALASEVKYIDKDYVNDVNKELVKLLLEYGASARMKDPEGGRPLLLTPIYNWNSEVLKILLDAGASVNESDSSFGVPLMAALKLEGNSDVMNLLLDYGGIDIKAKDLVGRSILHTCVWATSLKVLRARYSDDELREIALIPDKLGCTMLHHVANHNELHALEWGVKTLNLPVNQTDNLGWTPLHWAVHSWSKDCIQFLIASSADLKVEDKHGWTPYNVAMFEISTEDISELLQEGLTEEQKAKKVIDFEWKAGVGTACDFCEQECTAWWKTCTVCENYDLCSRCFQDVSIVHPFNHEFQLA